MSKSVVLLLGILIAVGLVCGSAGAVSVLGTKFYDYNQDGIKGSNAFTMEGWTIYLKYLNGTNVPGAQDVTDSYGEYNISGVDPFFDYYVCEVLQPGWTNTTPLCKKIGFVTCGGGPLGSYEFFVDYGDLDTTFDNTPDGDSVVLLGYNARIGNAVTQTGNAEELKISYPLGQWNAGQSSSNLSPSGEYTWVNNTYTPFNATWTPGATLYQNAKWTVNGVTVQQNLIHPRPDAVPVRDILIKLHSEDPDYIVELNNLTLKQGTLTYNLLNSPINFSEIDANDQDLCLVIRASDILMNLTGSDIGSGGFSLTGDARFTWPPGNPKPANNEIKFDIYIGRYNCNYNNYATADFGNHINGSISGYKVDQNENPLAGWNITAYNITREELYFDITDANGYYNISDINLGYYWLNETPQEGFTQLTPNRTVQINVTTLHLFNQNFTNEETTYCIEGYKIDNCTKEGLPGWNITATNASVIGPFAEVWNATTNETGYYRICNLSSGNYTICEELKAGWTNVSPLCREVNITNVNLTDINFTNTRLLCIEGYKIDNTTGNGLPGWNITVSNQTTEIEMVTTNDTGWYRVCGLPPGEYQLCEELKTGYRNLTPLCRNVTLTCSNATNVNFTNEAETYCIEGYKIDNCTKQGLEGWNITVRYGLTEFGNATTNASGWYRICGLLPGDYVACEELKAGWTNVTPLIECQGITIETSNLTNINFTNTRLLCIEGYKIDNTTGNGLPGWNITVSNQTAEIETVITNATGWYQVCGLPPGEYQICEELKEGFTNVTSLCQNVTLACSNATNVNFTNEAETYCIEGYKIDNCSGGLEGWNVTVQDVTGAEVGNATTNASGWYQICGLLPGDYTVCEELKAGWINVTSLCQNVTITTVNLTDANFTNTRLLCIEGYKLDYTTLQGLAGWNISISNETMTLAEVTTNATGWYQFCGLPPGEYQLCEELKPGYVNITPLCQNITLTCVNETEIYFTNEKTYCINGTKIDSCSRAGLSGWKMTVYNETSGVEVGNNTTNQNGYYEICGLMPGNYWICEEEKAGYTNVSEVCWNFTIFNGNIIHDFENTRLLCINGTKINNQTGQPIPSWNITITNETGAVIETQTDSNGYYEVCGLPYGEYRVCEEQRTGWTNVTPVCRNVTLECTNGVAANGTVNFENIPAVTTGYINGYKLWHETGQGLEDWTIVLVNETTNSPVTSTTTDSNGFYNFTGLAFDYTYNVSEILKPGWTPVGPMFNNTLALSLTTPYYTNVNFTNDPNGSISGYKIDQACGCGAAGWEISLYNQTTGTPVGTTTTGSNGYYEFTGLTLGTFWVNETLKDGWVAITAPKQQVSLTVDQPVVTYVNFTNAEEKVCCECSPNAKFTYTKSGQTVNFKDATEGPQTVKWYWNFGDRTTSTLQNPTKTYGSHGTYTVTLYVKWADCSGATSTYWKSYTERVTV